MGDIADDCFDQAIEEYYNPQIHPFDDPPSLGGRPQYLLPRNKICRRCGQDGLHWKFFDMKWRLAQTDGAIHVCNGKKGFTP